MSGNGAAEKKGSYWGQQTSAPFNNSARSLSWLQSYHHKENFKVNPNFLAKSCLGKLESCQKTGENSRPLHKQALRDNGYCTIKLSAVQAHDSFAYVTSFSTLQPAGRESKSCGQIKLPRITSYNQIQVLLYVGVSPHIPHPHAALDQLTAPPTRVELF